MYELDKKIILFDGVCNLCNSSVLYIIKRDKKDVFRYAALQSEIGQKFIKERKINISKIDSIILIDPNVAYYTKSTAAIKIMNEFGGLWQIMNIFNYILPTPLRNIIYDFIAKNRYKWFGKQDHCMVSTPTLQAKFID